VKLATFAQGNVLRVGVVVDDELADLSATPGAPPDMLTLLDAGRHGLEAARAAAAKAPRVPMAEAWLRAPVARPPKFLGIGVNFRSHRRDISARAVARAPRSAAALVLLRLAFPRPSVPVFFNKQSTCVTGPTDPIYLPPGARRMDYEGELGVVIGARCRHLSRRKAAEAIAGYLVTNDVSVREWQMETPTVTLGKSYDSHGPIGPWIVTADELGDPHDLRIRTWVNGELRQDDSTDGLICDCFEAVATLSRFCTLEAGDVLAMGTPAGVGAARGRFLRERDEVTVEIEGIGRIQNRVVRDPLAEVV
jgi:2-keto-4-pentenoate hydratase/2-oxohepta-3-ene-1,7-dioic acid hydratase in catechol pathway